MNLEQEMDEYIRKRHYRQINSVLVCRDDEILAQRYYNGFDENSRNEIKSVAKSIMSIVMGIALDHGLIDSLDMPVYKFIPQLSEGRDMLHRAITLRHLLTMTSGIYWNGGIHYHCPMMTQLYRSHDWISHIADCAVASMPGSKWVYKEWDVILLAKVLDVVCGDLYDYLNAYLYRPLGIQSERWFRSSCGVSYSVGGYDGEGERQSDLSALDMLKIGQLFLHKGIYEGQRIVSEEYIDQALAPSVAEAEYGLGYGFLWWLGDHWYGCRGFGGQSITVVPERNAVIVTQATPTSRGMGYHDVIGLCMERLVPGKSNSK